MGRKMETPSSPGSSPPDQDIDLPDAPPQQNGEDGSKKPTVALEDLFDQDSDDEFPTSSASPNGNNNVPSSPPTQSAPTSSAAPSSSAPVHQAESYSDPNLMLQFYSRLFPFRVLFHWLNHSPRPSTSFTNREFALTLPNDAYLRYQSYATADLLRRDILRLNPSRFEIGPVYTTNPRDRKTLRKASLFKPLAKEIVFDIDLTDYDDIRSCCTGANICAKCWTFATMAIKTIDPALREDFGFKHIMWVYSGRRGVHAWISDKSARELDDDKRKAITGYFEVLKGGAQGGKRVNLKRPLHPHLVRSLEILKPYFQQSILGDQEPFLTEKGQERLLSLLPDKQLNEALRHKWASSPQRPSARKWADIDALAVTGVSKTLDTKQLMEAKQDILLEYTYPRLDVEVGKKRIHLLKSPFVVHPGTGRVCVPITTTGDLVQVEEFDPLSVPKVTELLKEVDAFGGANGTDQQEMNGDSQVKEEHDGYVENGSTMRKIADYEKTSLKPYVDVFERFAKDIMKEENVRIKRERDEDGVTGADGMEF